MRESEQRLRLLGDNLPKPVYQYAHELNGTPRFLYFSAGIEQLCGVKAEDVLRDPATIHRLILPGHFAALVEAEDRSKRDLSVFDMDIPMRRTDGQVRWMQLHSQPRKLPDGRVVWDGVQTDITDRKRAEERTRLLSEVRSQLLASDSPQQIVESLCRKVMATSTARRSSISWWTSRRAACT